MFDGGFLNSLSILDLRETGFEIIIEEYNVFTLILIIIVISLLILVHEWGHFYTARKLGVRVEEFGFGFPPRLFSRIKDGVRYSFNLFPFGGFVKIYGEHGEGGGQSESFASRPARQRFLILAAGVFMNFFLAWIIFSIGAAVGIPTVASEEDSGLPVSLVGVAHGSPAEKAGFRFGDRIIEMRSRDLSLRIESEKDVRDFVDAHRGEEVTFVVGRGKEVREVKAIPRVNVPQGEGPLGVSLGRLSLQRVPWYRSPLEGLVLLGRSIEEILKGLGSLVKEIIVTRSTSVAVSGPVGIFFFAHDARSLGFVYFLQFVGMLSVNLAVLNILPIPALDGGRILFLAIEKARGTKINPKIENGFHAAGLAFLLVVMLLITYRDIARIFSPPFF
jgi:regulator of sigma E protease